MFLLNHHHILYSNTKYNTSHYEGSEILQRDTVNVSKLEESNKKSVYKYVVTDSKGEYDFAKLLDNNEDEDVLLFTKLRIILQTGVLYID